jgi:BirA family transcriptional regulator, biotin operon repressor / biotin---[acetyl-CoA-carboxylase] ligase
MGRGRLDRKWFSNPFENIMMSVVLNTDLSGNRVFYLTMAVSVALVNAVKRIAGLNSFIKWPNDIYINNKKTAGILTEIRSVEKIKYAIIGIGINVNSDISLLPEIRDNATSLKNEAGRCISRLQMLCGILEEIEAKYLTLNQSGFDVIRNEWNEFSLVTGKKVNIINGNSIETGIAESLAEDGSLIILKEDGIRKKIFAGDVSLRIK